MFRTVRTFQSRIVGKLSSNMSSTCTHHSRNLNCQPRLNITDTHVSRLLDLLRRNNNFFVSGTKEVVPFYVGEKIVGLVRELYVPYIVNFPDVFTIDKAKTNNGYPEKNSRISLSNKLDSCEARTNALRHVTNELRKHSSEIVTLKGWRDEDYSVYHHFQDGPLFIMERAATCIFGVRRFGVHINGFVPNKETNSIDGVWIAQRSMNKPTYPGLLDNLAAGGLTSGCDVVDVAKKELQAEASVSESLCNNLHSVGVLNHCYEDERGICPEQLFVYDLALPDDFKPTNKDGEVKSFVLKTIPEVLELILQPSFKPNSALVMLDFLFRHGFVTPEHTKYYSYLIQHMHVDPFAQYSAFVQCPVIV